MIDSPSATDADVPHARSREISGRWLVVGLISLGLAATGIMFVYWDHRTRPFRPLREAIGREFRHSRPIVEGGRAKGRGPWILRISLSVDFPPAEDTTQSRQVADRIIEIIRQLQELDKVEQVEINLIQFVPEELAKTYRVTWVPRDGDIQTSEPGPSG